MELIHHHFSELPSTNDWAKKHLATFDREALTVVSTDRQTAGRGQLSKHWIGEGDNLFVSYCFFIQDQVQDSPALTRLLAQAAIEVLLTYGLSAQMKWPNDVMVHQEKIAGILCETTPFPPFLGIVMGIGLNVNMTPETLATIDKPATSLFVQTGKEENVKALLTRLTETFRNSLKI